MKAKLQSRLAKQAFQVSKIPVYKAHLPIRLLQSRLAKQAFQV